MTDRTPKIQPALTPDQWAAYRAERETFLDGYTNFELGVIDVRLGGVASESRDIEMDRKILAALALDGQPFGFTREDVTELQDASAMAVLADSWRGEELSSFLYRLADRIEALLPPEEPKE